MWPVGPLNVAVASHDPPPGWPQRVDGQRQRSVFRVTVEARDSPPVSSLRIEPGQLHGIHCTVEPDGCRCFSRDVEAFSARVDFAHSSASYRGRVDFLQRDTFPIFESFLRVVASGWLLRQGGALLHAASVSFAGEGFVFAGLSGAGKTTLVEGTDDHTYLSDDQSLLARCEKTGALEVWGSPFSGLAARRAVPMVVPLRALVLLQSTRPAETRLERVTPSADVVCRFLRHVCAFERTRDEAQRALAFIDDVMASVPVFVLERNLKDPLPTIVASIQRALATAPKEAA